MYLFKLFSVLNYDHKRFITFFFIRFFYLTFIYFSLVSPAFAAINNYDKGAFYFSQGDYLSALSFWGPLAQQGNSVALYSIGLLYDQGRGVEKDTQRALTYIQSAVDKNLPVAQYYLGMKYFGGLDVKKNTVKSRELMIKAAQSDYLQAQFQLANFYDKGEGGPQDSKLATQWFTSAAENGFGPAQHALASRFLTGRGVALNFKQGIFWLNKAAEQNDSDAMRDLGFMYFKGMGVTKDYQQSYQLLLTPAEEGSGLARYLIGEIYRLGGNGIDKNKQQAKKWFELAEQSGYPNAQKRLKQLSQQTEKKRPLQQATLNKPVVQSLKKQTFDSRSEQDTLRFKQLDDQHYLLQIIAVKQYTSVRQLTDKYVDDSTYLLNTKKGDDHLFIMTYGDYSSHAEAQQAISQLPKAFQLKSKPWIRQIKHLKALLF